MLRDIVFTDWYVISIVVCIVLLTITKYIFTSRFNDFLLLLGNSKYLKIYARDQRFIDSFDGLLFSNLIISLTLFCIIAYNTLIEPLAFDIILFSKIIVGIGGIILIKILLERLIGSLFEIDALIDSYIFQKTNYKNYIGLLLLPINIILYFALTPTPLTIYIVLAIIIIINSVGFVTSFLTQQKLIINNFFYFILYLCALEIAPYIILYKAFII